MLASEYFIPLPLKNLNDLQRELTGLFSDVASGLVEVSSLDEVGYLVPIEKLSETEFPATCQLLHHDNLKPLMNSTFLRFLITDPEKKDADTPSGYLDRYFPHRDKNTNEKIPAGSLNIPLENCNQKTVTLWHLLDQNSMSRVVRFDWVDILYDPSPETVVEASSLGMDMACLMRTETFHSVVNSSGRRRVIAAWHTAPGISWQQLVEKFRTLEGQL